MLNQIIITLYCTFFIYHCFYRQQFQWLWASVAIGIGFSALLGRMLLPGILGITAFNSLYLIYSFITVASLFFWMNHWRYDKESKKFQDSGNLGWYLPCLAVSGFLMLLAYLTLLLLFYSVYPDGFSGFFLMSHLQAYFLQPTYWIVSQWALMVVMFMLCKRINKESRLSLHYGQMQLFYFLSFIMQLAYLAWDVRQYMAIWQ
jgi:hypothetical protein